MPTALSIRPTDNLDFFSLNVPDGFFKEMQAIHDEIAREAFNLFEQRNGNGGNALDDWLRAESRLLKPMPISIANERDQVKVTAEVPGFTLNELKVHIDGQELEIYGSSEKTEKADKKTGDQQDSTSSRKMFSKIVLPTAVKADAASAILDKGVLTLTLPKAELAKEIAVKAA